MRRLLAWTLLTFALPVAGAANPQVTPFIPQEYTLLQGKAVDLNGDGRSDRLLVLQDSRDPDGQRRLVILEGTKGGFRQTAQSDTLLLCEQCGGVWGDPLDSIQAGRGWFQVSHYGGSNWRWAYHHTFKLRQGRWVLTGLDLWSSNPFVFDSERQEHIPPTECQQPELSGFLCGQEGGGDLQVSSQRAYFYSSPEQGSRTGKYVIAGQTVSVYRVYRNFVEAAFVAEDGTTTSGYLRRADLRK